MKTAGMNFKAPLKGWQLQPFKPVMLMIAICFLSACNNEPQPLEFGKDVCAFCRMTVIDKKFGAELVNSKGKTVKFDSEECMLSYLKNNKDFKPETYQVINYQNPGELIDAQKAFYLVGGNIKSPMGGKMAAFKNMESAKTFQEELKGDLLLWNKILPLNI